MKKTLWFVLILLVSAFGLSAQTDPGDIRMKSEDCGRLVEITPGTWAPQNLCPDGTIPNKKDCSCPGTRKWDRSVGFVKVSKVSANSFRQPKTQFAIPDGTDLVKYPLVGKNDLTPRRVAEMGLYPTELKEAMTGYNYHRDLNRFVFEVLPKGTVVYSTADRIPIYKADCANRLAQVTSCPKCAPVAPSTGNATIKPNGGKNAKGNSADTSGKVNLASAMSSGTSFGDFMKFLGNLVLGILKFLAIAMILILAALLLLAFLVWAVRSLNRIGRDAEDWWRGYRARRREEREARLLAEQGALSAAGAIRPESVLRGPFSFFGGGSTRTAETPSSGGSEIPPVIPIGSETPRTESGPGSAKPAAKFVAFYVGSESKLRFGGYKSVKLNEEGGITTITVS